MLPLLSDGTKARFLKDPACLIGTGWLVGQGMYVIALASEGRVIMSHGLRTLDLVPEWLLQEGTYVGTSSAMPTIGSMYVYEPRDPEPANELVALIGAICEVKRIALGVIDIRWLRWNTTPAGRALSATLNHLELFSDFRPATQVERLEGSAAMRELAALRHPDEALRRIMDRTYVEEPPRPRVRRAPRRPPPPSPLSDKLDPKTAWDRLNADEDLVSEAKP
jgi:hypothetical protein